MGARAAPWSTLPPPQRRARLQRRALLLAYATAGYNLAESGVAIAAGALASSAALIAFGLDSLLEVSSALVVVWQFHAAVPEQRERRALKLIGACFFALAVYVTFDALRSLLGTPEAEPSPLGIALAVASLVVMPLLAWVKRRTGQELGSATVVADSTQTLLCAWLSAVLLGGLVANATLGWSWADPLVALFIAAVALREGTEAWRGEGCCVPAGGLPDRGSCDRYRRGSALADPRRRRGAAPPASPSAASCSCVSCAGARGPTDPPVAGPSGCG
ncbi:MAG TPA: cation transporter [Egibacteraceae bacterium]|nr:cation transporter [Actinomycetota bacterium]HWB73258.1 cation transporter [Egibacteraceae bacterium]